MCIRDSKILVVKQQDPPKDEQHIPVTYHHQDLIVNSISFIEMYLREPLKYIIHQNLSIKNLYKRLHNEELNQQVSLQMERTQML